MAIDFPTSPTPNQLHTAGSRSWSWNNSVGAWYAVNAGVQGIQGIQGTQGTQGLQGITGSQGTQGTQGIQGIQGVQGIQGITGLAFTIAKTYLSVAALNADTAPTAIVAGQFALINTTNVEDAENSRLYIWTGSTYTFVDDLSGSAGIQGITGSQGVQGIQGIQGITGTQGAVGSQGTQGQQGIQGIQGISGASILGTNNTFTGTNAFTSVTASGLISAIMTSNGTGVSVQSTAESAGGSQPSFVFKNTVGTTKSYMYCNVGAGDVALNIAGTDRLFITSTGLNSTAIGATTPSTGAFTTVGATGATRITTNNVYFAGTTTGAANQNLIGVGSDDNTYIQYKSGQSARFSNGVSNQVEISATGAAITGTLSSTGNLSTTSDLRVTDTAGSKHILIGNQNSGGTNTPVILRGVNATLQIGTGTSWSASGGGTLTTIADFSSTGLAVTGTLSATGNLTLNTNGNISLTTAQGTGSQIYSLQTQTGEWGIGSLASDNKLYITNRTGSQALGYAPQSIVINSSGNVGIGTTSPAVKLQVTTSGAAALPPTTGTTPSTGELIRLRTSSDTAGGIGTIGLSTNQMWLQATDATGLGTSYQLLLNPNGGNVGIANTAPNYKLEVTGTVGKSGRTVPSVAIQSGATTGTPAAVQNGDLWWNTDTGVLNIWYSTASAWIAATPVPDSTVFYRTSGGNITGNVAIQGLLSVTGNIQATGTITGSYSDERLKDVSGNIKNALSKVMLLNGVEFKPNDTAKYYGFNSDESEVGVIAQQVQAVLPEVVKPAPFDSEMNDDGVMVSKSGENYITVQYERMVPLLIEAIKEQQAQIEKLNKALEKFIKE